MALTRIPVQRGSLERKTTGLTVIAIAEILADTPGLSEHLATDTSASVVRCPAISEEVVSICHRFTPCVLVADVSFLACINLAKLAIATDSGRLVKTLIVVDEDDPKICQGLLRTGFDGIIQRSAPCAVFRRAFDAIAQGELWASRKSISALVREFLSGASPRKLTAREREIFGLLAKGYKNREIAAALFVSRDTIRWHLRSIYSKLGLADRGRAMEYALAEARVPAIKPNVAERGGRRPRRACS